VSQAGGKVFTQGFSGFLRRRRATRHFERRPLLGALTTAPAALADKSIAVSKALGEALLAAGQGDPAQALLRLHSQEGGLDAIQAALSLFWRYAASSVGSAVAKGSSKEICMIYGLRLLSRARRIGRMTGAFMASGMLALVLMIGAGAALAQAEPTMGQIYETAQAGQLEQAQKMVQQVLLAHPSSAKARFVQAELFARQGQTARARDALATAEKLAPGLPFAKPEAVRSLRQQLANPAAAELVPRQPAPQERAGRIDAARPVTPATTPASFPWGMGLLLGGVAIAAALYFLRKKPAVAQTNPSPYATNVAVAPAGSGSGLSGPQSFGNQGSNVSPSAYPGYGAPGYPPAAGSGLGGRVMGGLATGLAVGAGVMAAQAIGKSLTGHDEHVAAPATDRGSHPDAAPAASDYGMGGNNFGVNDGGSWDDAGAGSSGGDWDN
jgi:uncharacterized protein